MEKTSNPKKETKTTTEQKEKQLVKLAVFEEEDYFEEFEEGIISFFIFYFNILIYSYYL